MSTAPFSPMLAGVLRSGRDGFNARFADMKRRHPSLDADAFSHVLLQSIAPLAESVGREQPDRVPAVVWAAYDAALQLVAERLSGPSGRHPMIEVSWQRLLPAVTPLLTQSPGKMIAAVSNALCHLSSTMGADPEEWVERMLACAPQLTTVEHFLAAGKLAAWRCGLAHFREGALAAGDTLPEAVALRLLGCTTDGEKWAAVRARVAEYPWWTPGETVSDIPKPRVVKAVGSFRGFGGLFAEPPIVGIVDGNFVVRSGDEAWLLICDAFGATFHRVDMEYFNQSLGLRIRTRYRVEPTSVTVDSTRLDLAELGEITSSAALPNTLMNGRRDIPNSVADPHTLAVTGKYSHGITLIALR
ncbi:hypothetical protein [Roseimicrobium sp. ORNL1]|uniref:hypothetical protein n=1 Tax=Roseimicrobium sp. ORNL1 TaxID=2711231 RepID=UPI0013E17115|nr:hypothetical protein [Roseimicrobium sp. ORNL1]QIF03544.1 hypothetical protein G5S37_19110 [Roseimicrobium sp. ORNL1]